jgi:hypothetical protein
MLACQRMRVFRRNRIAPSPVQETNELKSDFATGSDLSSDRRARSKPADLGSMICYRLRRSSEISPSAIANHGVSISLWQEVMGKEFLLRRLPLLKKRFAIPCRLGLPPLWREEARDVQNQLRRARCISVDGTVRRRHDRHVRSDCTVDRIEGRNFGAVLSVRPQRQISKSTLRHNGCIEHIRL